jgi:hypothetical protein
MRQRGPHFALHDSQMCRGLLLLLTIVMLSSCRDAPNREEALEAFRALKPGVDSSAVVVRVWSDGPPWFSCAEVIAKLRSDADRATVRDVLLPWRSLVLAGLVTLRDTASGHVVEPGWCVAILGDSSARLASGWQRVRGDSLPSGGRRRGWDVPAGTREVSVVDAPRRIGSDSATVRYLFTTAANENGIAVGADRDSVVRSAVLTKVDGRWRVLQIDDAR